MFADGLVDEVRGAARARTARRRHRVARARLRAGDRRRSTQAGTTALARRASGRSSAPAATCAGSGRGSAAITASSGSTARRRRTRRRRRCGPGGTYPDQVKFAKGHGTQNDFVLLPDLDAAAGAGRPPRWPRCATAAGASGADGVLRVTTAGAAALARACSTGCPRASRPSDWYMDYRNADGSIAQMCGNGVRVFAHYLRASGLERRDEFVVGSLAGPRPVVLHRVDATAADVTVEMGKTNQLGTGSAIVGGRRFTGLAVDVGNPHLACVDPTLTAARAGRARRRRTGVVRRRAVSRRRQRRGADRTGRRCGVDAGARTWCRRNPFVRNRNRGGRRRRAAHTRARRPARLQVRIPGGEVTVTDHRRHQLPARPVGLGGPRRDLRGMVARAAALIQMHETL